MVNPLAYKKLDVVEFILVFPHATGETPYAEILRLEVR